MVTRVRVCASRSFFLVPLFQSETVRVCDRACLNERMPPKKKTTKSKTLASTHSTSAAAATATQQQLINSLAPVPFRVELISINRWRKKARLAAVAAAAAAASSHRPSAAASCHSRHSKSPKAIQRLAALLPQADPLQVKMLRRCLLQQQQQQQPSLQQKASFYRLVSQPASRTPAGIAGILSSVLELLTDPSAKPAGTSSSSA